jgi:hypothetical protein
VFQITRNLDWGNSIYVWPCDLVEKTPILLSI